jgi:hypothetical protein
MSKGRKPELLPGKSKRVMRENAFRLLKWGLTPREAAHRVLVHAGYRNSSDNALRRGTTQPLC